MPTCARCQQSKPTVSVHTGFAGESELLCGDCVFAEFNELEDKIEALEGRAAGQTSGDALREALSGCVESLDSIWAAIGDALCSGKGIEKGYSNQVASEVRKASDMARAALKGDGK